MAQTNLSALQAAIKLLADAASDVLNPTNTQNNLLNYQNLVPDVLALVPQIGDIPTEASSLSAEDYSTLLANLTTDLKLTSDKTGKVIVASLKLLADLVNILVPDVEAVVAAIKST